MNFDDFYEIPRGVLSGKYEMAKAKLDDVQVIKFVKGSEKMYWVTNFDEEFHEALFLQKIYSKSLGKDFWKSQWTTWCKYK